MRPQQFERALDERPRRVATAQASQPFVGADFDKRVVLNVGIGPARPAMVVRSAAERDGADFGDFHGVSSEESGVRRRELRGFKVPAPAAYFYRAGDVAKC